MQITCALYDRIATCTCRYAVKCLCDVLILWMKVILLKVVANCWEGIRQSSYNYSTFQKVECNLGYPSSVGTLHWGGRSSAGYCQLPTTSARIFKAVKMGKQY